MSGYIGYEMVFGDGKPSGPYKTTFTNIQDIPGIYLVMPGSNSVWAGFASKTHAKNWIKKSPGFKLIIRK